jgi:tRNA(Ile)-lysidine synthase
MPRSHPPTLITLTRAAFRQASLAPPGSRILAAVSGGPDSMALLHVLSILRSKLAFGLFAHGVDHGLRAEAGEELDRAAELARSLEVPFARTQLKLARGGNLQARARDARWGALEAAARTVGADRIATGHHAEDRAETFLIRLLRGTGPAGLTVLPPRANERIRPFYRARRADIEAHLHRHRIPFSVDPSNADPRFLRARVRHELLPLLETLSPRIVEHICRISDDLGGSSRTDPS